ncbi:MAG: hypothetical protein KDA22_13720 [Phycisphaerales bacterium]|nr:hypothetical protein [Phycisphaerales bacterium]
MATPLYYTFGNHMHWTDMQWLWGHDVLPGSVDDMLHLIAEARVKGNVNFDGIGYEKMAAECPEALIRLRDAVARGDVEPVGCTYGQPYGLFHGGESNVRQLAYGIRAVRRHLGVRPRTFWEEEFDFFPQQPQLLRACGYSGACLFFQWTWHTPEIPRETHALIEWEGLDGSRLPTLPRNDLNIHQWPEEFDGLLAKGLVAELPLPAVVQWLELMPSRDWMCRSELLLPRLKALMADQRFELRPRTMGALIAELRAGLDAERVEVPVRAYRMHDVWHGMTLGKNAYAHPGTCATTEARLRDAESLAATASLLGRPYPSWDVYPTWELEDGWRLLLAAEHHDNHECEGLCGHVASSDLALAGLRAHEVHARTLSSIGARVPGVEIPGLVSNAAGWTRRIHIFRFNGRLETVEVPPFGYASDRHARSLKRSFVLGRKGKRVVIGYDDLEAEFDAATAGLRQLRSRDWPDGVLDPQAPAIVPLCPYADESLPTAEPAIENEGADGPIVRFSLEQDGIQTGLADWSIGATARSLRLQVSPDEEPERPGFAGALRLPLALRFPVRRVRCGTPFGAVATVPAGPFRRKYPEGDWMTTPQWFETVGGAVTGQGFVDLLDEGSERGLLIASRGAIQVIDAVGRRADIVLNVHDPWDDGHPHGRTRERSVELALVPHGPLDNADVARLARHALDFPQSVAHASKRAHESDLPSVFGPLEIRAAPGVVAEAFFRESMKSGEHFPDWAGHRMNRDSGGACTHPFVIRLVEWNGEATEAHLVLAGPVATAAKTNPLGECGGWRAGDTPPDAPSHLADTGWLDAEPAEAPEWATIDGHPIAIAGVPVTWTRLRVPLRPHEIATVYADMVLGRKAWRDLDAKRKHWATVHTQTER